MSEKMERAPDWTALAEAVAAGLGMCLFAFFAHAPMPARAVAVVGLSLAAAVLCRAVLKSPSPLGLFGLWPVPRRTAIFVPIALVLGVAAALGYRYHLAWPLVPRAAGGFALVAAAIGGAEELLYRGFVQGRARRLGPIGAIFLAAGLHTAYKTLLFAGPAVPLGMDLPFIITWTLVGGIVFGQLREVSGGVLAPLAAHVAFDILVYADQAQAPWWVWS